MAIYSLSSTSFHWLFESNVVDSGIISLKLLYKISSKVKLLDLCWLRKVASIRGLVVQPAVHTFSSYEPPVIIVTL